MQMRGRACVCVCVHVYHCVYLMFVSWNPSTNTFSQGFWEPMGWAGAGFPWILLAELHATFSLITEPSNSLCGHWHTRPYLESRVKPTVSPSLELKTRGYFHLMRNLDSFSVVDSSSEGNVVMAVCAPDPGGRNRDVNPVLFHYGPTP